MCNRTDPAQIRDRLAIPLRTARAVGIQPLAVALTAGLVHLQPGRSRSPARGPRCRCALRSSSHSTSSRLEAGAVAGARTSRGASCRRTEARIQLGEAACRRTGAGALGGVHRLAHHGRALRANRPLALSTCSTPLPMFQRACARAWRRVRLGLHGDTFERPAPAARCCAP